MVFPPWKDDCAELLGGFVKGEVVVTTVEVKASGMRESGDAPDDHVNVWNGAGGALESGIKAAEVGEETDAIVFLWFEKGGRCPGRGLGFD